MTRILTVFVCWLALAGCGADSSWRGPVVPPDFRPLRYEMLDDVPMGKSVCTYSWYVAESGSIYVDKNSYGKFGRPAWYGGCGPGMGDYALVTKYQDGIHVHIWIKQGKFSSDSDFPSSHYEKAAVVTR